jgi:hypothetical protein
LDCTATPDAIIALTTTGWNKFRTNQIIRIKYLLMGAPAASTDPYTATAVRTCVYTITDANNATPCTNNCKGIILDPVHCYCCSTNVSCNGVNDGTMDTIAGESTEYSLFDGLPLLLSKLEMLLQVYQQEQHVVTVRNARQCFRTFWSNIITEPILNAAAVADVNSKCSNTTVITVTASENANRVGIPITLMV